MKARHAIAEWLLGLVIAIALVISAQAIYQQWQDVQRATRIAKDVEPFVEPFIDDD